MGGRNSISPPSAIPARYLPFSMRNFLLNSSVRISFFFLLSAGLILFVTGYSFTNNVINIVITVVIILYPVALFLSSQIRWWLKIVITLTSLILIVLALWNLPVAIAFSRETKQTIQTWKIGSKQVLLERRQGWAGPSYLKYQLKDFRMFGLIVKTIASGYPNSADNDGCKVKLAVEDYSNTPIYEFNSCEKTLRSLKLNGR